MSAPTCPICQTNRYMVRFENPTRYECSNTEGHRRAGTFEATKNNAKNNRGGRRKK